MIRQSPFFKHTYLKKRRWSFGTTPASGDEEKVEGPKKGFFRHNTLRVSKTAYNDTFLYKDNNIEGTGTDTYSEPAGSNERSDQYDLDVLF